MPTNFIGVLLSNSPTYTVDTGFSTQLYDATGAQTINLQSGASLALLGATGANTIRLTGNISNWQVMRDGSTAIFIHTDGNRLEVAASTTGQTIQFDDGNRSLRIDATGASPEVVLGSQTLGLSATIIGADTGTPTGPNPPGAGSTAKTPWTLVMTVGPSGLYASDGTAEGTGSALSSTPSAASTLITNPAQTRAILYGYFGGTVYGTDGTASGTESLGQKATNSASYTAIDDRIIFFGSTGLLTDGTAAGTTTTPNLKPGIVDTTNRAIWSANSTVPYGMELFRTTVSADSVSVAMVKDISPGASSGYQGGGALLPNGKLVFRATDNGVWVSDGTESGTTSLVPGGTEFYFDFTIFNYADRVVVSGSRRTDTGFVASLFFSDGSTAGSKFLDVSGVPYTYYWSSSFNPSFLGEVNGLLYFIVPSQPAVYITVPGIYSTDGTNFNRLADISVGASLLAWDASKAFFRVGSQTYGEELWVADLINGGFALVKDILPGSGSALGNASGFMVGGQLAFHAYTSATEQALFLSDGTAAGTVQIGSGLSSQTKVVGSTLFFTNASGIHAVNVTTSNPSVIDLTATTVSGLQTDADQAFYLATTAQLFASNGLAAPAAPLAANVSQFKVVAENAVFFIQNTTNNSSGTTKALWYSDGTVAGTRFIEDLPNSDYNLSTAVALRTPGVALPPDTAAPELVSASVNAANLTLTYSEALDAAHPPLTSAFSLAGTTATVSSVTVNSSAKTVSLTLSSAVPGNAQITISYTGPSSNNDTAAIQDSAGNDAASLLNRVVVNAGIDRMGPLFTGATINATSLVLSYSDANALDATNAPAPGAFSLSGTTATVSSVAVDSAAKTVTLTLSAAVQVSDLITVSYTDPSTGNDAAAIQDSDGNDASTLFGRPVTNQTLDAVRPVISSALVNGAVLTLTYTDTSPLDAANPPAVAAFSLAGTSATVTAVAVNSTDKTVTLTLSESVKSTETITLGYTDPTAGNDAAAIQDTAGNDATSLQTQAVTNQTPDNVGPIFSAAWIDGNTLTLTYTDTDYLGPPPETSRFSLGGTTATVSSVAVNGSNKTVTLTLSAAVSSTDVITLSYTDPTAGNDDAVIQDFAGNDAASLVAQAVQNRTPEKAPWTLILSNSGGLYASDATPAGSDYIPSVYGNGSLIANADQTRAVFLTYEYNTGRRSAYGTDGSTAGTALLAQNNIYEYSNKFILGDKIIITDQDQGDSWNGLITDGTIAGTTVVSGLNDGIRDVVNAAIWTPTYTVPYGYELYRTAISAGGASASMVKDIYPGASQGYQGEGALLPNGKLVFRADDGVNGSEAWVSDGTEAGTFMLADLYSSANSSYPYGFSSVGNKVAFIALVAVPDYLGRELVFTDGTSTGTRVLDIAPESSSSNPNILGQANGLLYFTATAPDINNVTSLGIYSTDGINFNRLANISASASLLGWDASKAFFRVGSQTYGDELWVADLITGGFALVKDILTGSGAALGDTYSGNSTLLNGKLFFNAYTSATAKDFFVSDGTSAGTLLLSGAASNTLTLSNKLIFSSTDGVYSVNSALSTPVAVNLVSGQANTGNLRADADQVFFTMNNGDFYVSNGTSSGTIKLAESVANFKVVAENAVYLIQDTVAGPASLWYSDGSTAGTRFIENVPEAFIDWLPNAVGIHTIGVPPQG